jgi:nicotinate-nucleotide pyrophosphorylase (carboxylating)
MLDQLIDLALAEDVGGGDVTTLSTIPAQTHTTGRIVAKQAMVLAGLDVFERVFFRVDPEVKITQLFNNGDDVAKGTDVIRLEGRAHSLLVGERIALNFLQRLCGIATQARTFAAALEGTSTRVVDTRKTTPGWRHLEKAAVRAGGGGNHRDGLFDGVLIKENHVAAAGGIKAAIDGARAYAHHLLKVECETTSLDEVQQALDAGADVIMLDNFDNDQTREGVELIRAWSKKTGKDIVIEASGNMTLERLPSVAACGVDIISMGALTHSVMAADLSMKLAGANG